MGKLIRSKQRGASALVGLLLAVGLAAAIVVPASASGGPTVTGIAAPSGHDMLLSGPGAIVQGLNGQEWFTTYDGTHYGLAEATTAGVVSELNATLQSGSTYPRMANGPGSFVWAVGDNGNNLSAIDSSGTQHVVTSTSNDDRDIVQGPDGKLYVADNSNFGVDQYTPNGTSTPGSQSFQHFSPVTFPDAIASAGGALWFTDDLGNLYAMTTSGTFAGPYDSGDFSGDGPGSMTAGPDGNLWIVSGSTIYKINPSDPSAAPATYTTGIPSGSTLTSITAGPDGNLYFPVANSTAASQGIGQITPSGTITILPLPSGYALPSSGANYAIAQGPGNTIWATAQTTPGGKAAVLEVSGLTIPTTSTTSTSTTTHTTSTTTSSTSTSTTTTTHKPPKRCAHGKVRKHGKCVKKPKKCPRGKVRKGKKCVKKHR